MRRLQLSLRHSNASMRSHKQGQPATPENGSERRMKLPRSTPTDIGRFAFVLSSPKRYLLLLRSFASDIVTALTSRRSRLSSQWLVLCSTFCAFILSATATAEFHGC